MKITSKTINYTVETVEELSTIVGQENDVIVVTDENRGGTFVYRSAEAGTNNGGTIFNGWCRQYDGAVNVKWFGAVGNGTNNDTTAIQKALDNTPIGSTLFFSKGNYSVTGAGTYILTLTRNINLVGDTTRGSVIRADISSTTTSILGVNITENSGASEVRGWSMSFLTMFFNGVGGLNSIDFYGGHRIFSSSINNCSLAGKNGGYSISVSDPSAFKHSVIELNTLNGAILGKFGDAVTIRKNLIFGDSMGVRIDLALGVYNTTVENNTIAVRDYAVVVRNGDAVRIINNQIEQVGVNLSYISATIHVLGVDRPCYNTVIENNNLGGGDNVDYSIYLENAQRTVITKNQIKASAVAEVHCTVTSRYNIWEFDNRVNGTISQPRTDTLFVAKFENNSSRNIQMPIALIGLNGWTVPTDSVYRDKAGMVHFTKPISGGTTTQGTSIFSIPSGIQSIQSDTYGCPCMDKNGTYGFIYIAGSIATIGSVGSSTGFHLRSYQSKADDSQ